MLSSPTAAEERARIARELHDVVAHGISVIAIQSDAACMALDRDRDSARDAILAAGVSAREALGEMRLLLDVLRADADDCGPCGPLPCLADIPALVERARAAGQEVTYTVIGTPRPLSASAGTSAYRIVQEAVTDATGATVHVTLAWFHDRLELRMRDDGRPRRYDLVATRERVRLHGGTLTSGPDEHETVAALPLGAL